MSESVFSKFIRWLSDGDEPPPDAVDRYYYNRATARYHDRHNNNRMVKAQTVMSALEGDVWLEGRLKRDLAAETAKLVAGDIKLADWQIRSAQTIKDHYIDAYLIGQGGHKNMTPSDWGKLGYELRSQYGYLNDFAVEISSGELTVAQIEARIQLYSGGARKMFFKAKTGQEAEAGYTLERRVLEEGAVHCPSCIGYAGEGWQPIGSLPEPGDACECNSNCRCHKVYAKGDSADQIDEFEEW